MKQAIALPHLAIGVLAFCLFLVVAGYQSALRQAQEARAAAAEERRYRVYYQDALANLQAERYDAIGGKRTVARLVERQQVEHTYTLWLERRLSRYEAGTPASWRASAAQQAQKEFRQAWASREAWAAGQTQRHGPKGTE